MRAVSNRRQGDGGAAMVLVLVVVVIASLLSTAFLGKSRTQLHAASVLQTKLALNYGADAGLEQGVAALSAELASSSRTSCLTPFEPPATVASFTWAPKAFPGTTTCQDLQGYASDSLAGSLYGPAIITTGGAGSLQTQSGVSSSLDVGGAIYLSGPENSADLKKQVNLTRGDLAVQGCTGTPAISEISVTTPYQQYCTGFTPSQVAPTITLPPVPTNAPAPFDLSTVCKIFFPGKYTNAPALLSGNGKSNYFASGDYYFDGSMTISVSNKMTVVGGAPSPGDVGMAGVTACSDDATAKLHAGTAIGAITSTGVAFFMGGASAIDVAQGTLQLYSRPLSAGYQIPLSLYAVRASDTGWDAWNGATSVIGNSNPNASMLFNGQINAYDAPVSLFASNPTVAAARAGVIAKALTLKASASGSGLAVTGYGPGTAAGFRIVKLTSHLTGIGTDGGAVDGVAVVKFGNDLSRPVVLSWRLS